MRDLGKSACFNKAYYLGNGKLLWSSKSKARSDVEAASVPGLLLFPAVDISK